MLESLRKKGTGGGLSSTTRKKNLGITWGRGTGSLKEEGRRRYVNGRSCVTYVREGRQDDEGYGSRGGLILLGPGGKK